MDVVEGAFHGNEVLNLCQWKFYQKVKNQKIWGYYITAKNYLWRVKQCAGVTPRPTQKRGSKTLFHLGLVASVINTYPRGFCTE